jgi:hypothetical protein
MTDYRIPNDYMARAVERLNAIGAADDEKRHALAIVTMIADNLDAQSFGTSRRDSEMAVQLGLGRTSWRRAIAVLERLSLVQRGKRGNTRLLMLVVPDAPRGPGPARFYAPPPLS